MNPDQTDDLQSSKLPTLHQHFYRFYPENKKGLSGLISLAGKRLRQRLHSQEYEAIKAQLTDQLSQHTTLDDVILERLNQSKPASEQLLNEALKAVAHQNKTLNDCLSLALSRSNSSQLSQTVNNIANINFLKKIAAALTEAAFDSGAKNIVDKRIRFLSLPDKGEIKQRCQRLFNELAKDNSPRHKPVELVDDSTLIGGLRFSRIIPPKATAIAIECLGRKQPTMLHANYVGNEYIAAQGPYTQAKNPESIPAFYRMLVENKVQVVVNLTHAEDSKSSPDLRVKYWPNAGKSVSYNLRGQALTIRTQHIDNQDSFDIITLEISHLEGKKRHHHVVQLFHFSLWPATGEFTPAQHRSYLSFLRTLAKKSNTGKTVVHCRTGVGRTGTVILTEQLRKRVEAGKVTRENFISEMRNLIIKGRQERGERFIQNAGQLELIIVRFIDRLP